MITEPQMQSTGQAGPPINRDLEVLFEKVREMVRAVNGLQTMVDALTAGNTGSPPSTTNTDTEGTGGVSTETPFGITYETPVVLAGFGETEDTEDAWTTLASPAPSGKLPLILFEISSTDNADVGSLLWRTESGAAEIPCVAVDSDEDDAQPRIWYFIVPDSDGNFEYIFNNDSSTTIDWKIYYLGYIT